MLCGVVGVVDDERGAMWTAGEGGWRIFFEHGDNKRVKRYMGASGCGAGVVDGCLVEMWTLVTDECFHPRFNHLRVLSCWLEARGRSGSDAGHVV